VLSREISLWWKNEINFNLSHPFFPSLLLGIFALILFMEVWQGSAMELSGGFWILGAKIFREKFLIISRF
jgi:hypothetical protein